MKILLPAMSILMVLCLASCKESEVKTEAQDAQPQPQKIAVTETADVQSQPQKMAVTGVHTVVIQEVIQSNSYTYLKVKEADTIHWVATGKTDIQAGETISFENPLEMKNFTSKELDRTFETIFFLGRINKESSLSAVEQPASTPLQKPAVEKSEIAIEPIEGGVSIGELFSNRDAYANKVVRIKGQVTKVNLSIMGKNWVHLQDGTGDTGSNDLLVTTQDVVTVGDVAIFEGTIALNKDFGAGYSYEVLMEAAKQQSE
ncbi:MAG: DNA-binding protein [Deltaproteobacteria bacterium]|nr:DNA-binding protein [Deltaproteobacteria bacterium]